MSLDFFKKGGEVTIIEINRQLIRDFKATLDEENNGSINVVIGTCENLPFKDEYFDIVYAGGVFHHLPNIKHGIKEAYRVLKKGGKLYADDPNIYNLPNAIARKLFAKDYDPNQWPLSPSKLERIISYYFESYSIKPYYPFFSYLVPFLEGDVGSVKGKEKTLKIPDSVKTLLDRVDEIFENLPLFKNTGAAISTCAIKR